MSIKEFFIILFLTIIGLGVALSSKPSVDAALNKVKDIQYKCLLVGTKNDGTGISSSNIVSESVLQQLKTKSTTFLGLKMYNFVEFDGEYVATAIPSDGVESAGVLCKKI